MLFLATAGEKNKSAHYLLITKQQADTVAHRYVHSDELVNIVGS